MLHFRPMTEAEFDVYAERSIRDYAAKSPRYKNVPLEEAVRAVHEEFHTKIAPQGIRTPGHLIWQIVLDQTSVGLLHLGPGENAIPGSKDIYAWEFLIYEPHRRKGYARQAMVEAEKKLRELGYLRVGLNVFGENTAAIKLYESMGFRVAQFQMARELG